MPKSFVTSPAHIYMCIAHLCSGIEVATTNTVVVRIAIDRSSHAADVSCNVFVDAAAFATPAVLSWPRASSPGPWLSGGSFSSSSYDDAKAAIAAQKLLRFSESWIAACPFKVTIETLALVLMPNMCSSEFSIEIISSWQLLAATHSWA